MDQKGGGGGGVFVQNICYHVAAFVKKIVMQHDHILKKFDFVLLTPAPKSTQGVKHRPWMENHV